MTCPTNPILCNTKLSFLSHVFAQAKLFIYNVTTYDNCLCLWKYSRGLHYPIQLPLATCGYRTEHLKHGQCSSKNGTFNFTLNLNSYMASVYHIGQHRSRTYFSFFCPFFFLGRWRKRAGMGDEEVGRSRG